MTNRRTKHGAGGDSGRLILRVIGILLLIGALAGITLYRDVIVRWAANTLALSASDPVPLLALEQTPIELELQADGEIVGIESVPVATPNTGMGALTLAWLAPEGTMAAAGEPLIRYNKTDMLLNLESQKSTVSENQLQSKIDGDAQLLSERSLSIDQTEAKMDYDYALRTKPEDPTIFSQWEIINASLNADFAKSKIENLAAKASTQKRLDRSARQISAIARIKAQAEADLLQQALSTMEVKARAEGLVVYRRDRRQDPQIGDNCQAGQVMIDLVNLNALQARIYVLEKEASGLAKGEVVTVHLDALPDKEFHGVVKSVSSLASSIERNGVLKYFTCDVTITDAKSYMKAIRPGMTLKARVLLVKYDSGFMVPTSALDYKEKEQKRTST